MGDWGIKISEEGYDVKTATTQQLIMSNAFNALKVKMVGTTTGNVAHGLAYVPIYFAMSKISATKWGIIGQNYFNGMPHCDGTNFISDGGGTSESKYYIFYETAE